MPHLVNGPRGLTLTEVLVASTVGVMVVFGASQLEVFRLRLADEVRRRSGVLTPTHGEAALATLRIAKGLEAADRVVVNAGGPSGTDVQVRVPSCPGGSARCFEDPANFRWDQYRLVDGELRLYRDTRAADGSARCGSRQVVARGVQGLTVQFVDQAAAPPGGEPFDASANDNNLLRFQLDWAQTGRTRQFVGLVTLRSAPYSDVGATDSTVIDSGRGGAAAGLSDPPSPGCP